MLTIAERRASAAGFAGSFRAHQHGADPKESGWLAQKLLASLFQVTVPTINEHLANLYAQGEITSAATIRKFRTVQKEVTRIAPHDDARHIAS